MSVNLSDYYIIISCLDNVQNNDIDNWINDSKKPKKVERNFKNLIQSGGSFTANNLNVKSSDITKVPFLIEMGGQTTIHSGNARFVHFTPSLDIEEVENKSILSNLTSDMLPDAVKVKKAKKRHHNDCNIQIKEEEEIHDFPKEPVMSPTPKKRKVNSINAGIDNPSTETAAIVADTEKTPKKKKKSKTSLSESEARIEKLKTNTEEKILSKENDSSEIGVTNEDKLLKRINNLSETSNTQINNGDAEVLSKKKRKSIKIQEESFIIPETSGEKKKRKSKVTFAENVLSPANIKKEKFSQIESPIEDFSLSSKFTANDETDVISDKKKKKRRHSQIDELPKESRKVDSSEEEKKIIKNRKPKLEKI